MSNLPTVEQQFDQLSLGILEHLQDDGRLSYREIGKRLGVAPGTVRARVVQLVEEGGLEIVAVPNPWRMGLTFFAVVGLRLEPGHADEVADLLAAREDVTWAGVSHAGRRARAPYPGGSDMTRWHVSETAGPAERGETFGRVYAPEITRTLQVYGRLFEQATERELDLDALGDEAMASIREFAPSIAEEIEGIARGSGLPTERIAALNARTEILARADRLTRGECSAVVSLGAGASPVALQTWDWHEELADCWLVWTIHHPDGRVVQTLTELGIVGKIGVSSTGVGVLFNILHHENDGKGIGVPVHVVARRVLDEAHDVPEALEIVSCCPCLSIVGDHAGGDRWQRRDGGYRRGVSRRPRARVPGRARCSPPHQSFRHGSGVAR